VDSWAFCFANVVPLLDSVRLQLGDSSKATTKLAFRRNLEGSVMRSLKITDREIAQVVKAYPDMIFSKDKIDGAMDDIDLIVAKKG
jgi:hypothetical protein